jgi:phosphoribosylglycinamide formyltransferase-1
MKGRKRLRVVVLASGRGGTFAALLAAQQDGRLPIEIVALLSDKRTARVLTVAESAGIATVALRPRDYPDRASFDRALFARVADFTPDLVVLAGYMRVIDSSVVGQWRGRMINLHPSLLPKYPGLQTHERALAAGDDLHGASVHYVTAELDGGPLIAQVRMPVVAGDTAETLAARLRPLERQLLVRVVELISQGRLALGAATVEFDGHALVAPLRI